MYRISKAVHSIQKLIYDPIVSNKQTLLTTHFIYLFHYQSFQLLFTTIFLL